MIAVTSIAVLLVVLSTFAHYEALRFCNGRLQRLDGIPERAKVLLAMGAGFCSHLVQIAVFAVGYCVAHRLGLGRLDGQFHGALSALYFSAETYTSLGYGDVYPTGAMRLIAGIEALTGLLMISWTASFTYLEMGRHWFARER